MKEADLKRLGFEFAGVVGVDSGQLMITDPCYVVDDCFTEKDYEDECIHTDKTTQLWTGAAGRFRCDSGFGDGEYNVFVKVEDHGDWGKRIAAVAVIMIDDDLQ